MLPHKAWSSLEDGHYDLDDIASPEGLPTEDTQDVNNPAVKNAPPRTHSVHEREWEEDAISRAMRASRQANLDHDGDFPGGGGSTLIGGSTSSSSPMARMPLPATGTSTPTPVNATTPTEPKNVNLRPPMMDFYATTNSAAKHFKKELYTAELTRNSTAPQNYAAKYKKEELYAAKHYEGFYAKPDYAQYHDEIYAAKFDEKAYRQELCRRALPETLPRQELCRRALREALQPGESQRWTKSFAYCLRDATAKQKRDTAGKIQQRW